MSLQKTEGIPADPTQLKVLDTLKSSTVSGRCGNNALQIDRLTTEKLLDFYADQKKTEQLVRNTDGSSFLLRKVLSDVKVISDEWELCECTYAPAGAEIDLIKRAPGQLMVRNKQSMTMLPFAFIPEHNCGIEPSVGYLARLVEMPIFKDLAELSMRVARYETNLKKTDIADDCKLSTWILDKAEAVSCGLRTVQHLCASREYVRELNGTSAIYQFLIETVFHDMLEVDERQKTAFESLSSIPELQLVVPNMKIKIPKNNKFGGNPSLVELLCTMKAICVDLKIPQHLTHPLIVVPKDVQHFRNLGRQCSNPVGLLIRLAEASEETMVNLISENLVGPDYGFMFARCVFPQGQTKDTGAAIVTDCLVPFLVIPNMINTLDRMTERLGVGAMKCFYSGFRSQLSQIIGMTFAYDSHLPIICDDSLGDLLGIISSAFTPSFPRRTMKTQITEGERYVVGWSDIPEKVQGEIQALNNSTQEARELHARELIEGAIDNKGSVVPDPPKEFEDSPTSPTEITASTDHCCTEIQFTTINEKLVENPEKTATLTQGRAIFLPQNQLRELFLQIKGASTDEERAKLVARVPSNFFCDDLLVYPKWFEDEEEEKEVAKGFCAKNYETEIQGPSQGLRDIFLKINKAETKQEREDIIASLPKDLLTEQGWLVIPKWLEKEYAKEAEDYLATQNTLGRKKKERKNKKNTSKKDDDGDITCDCGHGH